MKEYYENIGYRTLINSSVLSGIGSSLYNIVFVIYASTLPYKTLAVSLASMASLIPSLMQIFIGYIADHTKFKTIWMLRARVIQTCLYFILALLIDTSQAFGIFIILLVINILSDMLTGFTSSLSLPLYRQLITSEKLDSALSFEMATQTTVVMIFQGVGAWMIVLLNNRYDLFGIINGLTFLLAAYLLWRQRQLFKTKESKLKIQSLEQSHSFIKSFKITLQELLANPRMKVILVGALLVNTLGTSVSGLLNVGLLENVRLQIMNLGNTIALFNIVFSTGTILGALLANDFLKNTSIGRLIIYTMASICLIAWSFISGYSVWLVLLFSFACSYLLGKINPRISAFMMREISEERLATSSGVISLVVMVGGPIGQFFFLGIANMFTPQLAWFAYGVVATCMTLLLIIVINRLERQVSLQENTDYSVD